MACNLDGSTSTAVFISHIFENKAFSHIFIPEYIVNDLVLVDAFLGTI
jgi:hypothetical protein